MLAKHKVAGSTPVTRSEYPVRTQRRTLVDRRRRCATSPVLRVVPRSLGLVVGLLAGCSLVRRPEPTVTAALRARQLMVPVAHVSPGQVPDTFRARRGGVRIHGAVDIPAPRGTLVVSTDDGRVVRLSRNRKGGLTIYATDTTERFVYYYAHLDSYRRGLANGTRLARGEVIGFVGTTGDAPRRAPHLHFQVMDASSPLGAEGIPFVFDRFSFLGLGQDYDPDRP